MNCKAELSYLEKVLRAMHLQMHVFDPDTPPTAELDCGLRELLGWDESYGRFIGQALDGAGERTVYRVVDEFGCHYSVLRLMGRPRGSVLIIGPYLAEELTHSWMREKAERLGVPPEYRVRFESCFSSIPCLGSESQIFALINGLAETLWGRDSFEVTDINLAASGASVALPEGHKADRREDLLENMHRMEERYAYENQLLDLVSRGWGNRAEMMINNVSQLILEERTSESLRNAKNYAIVFNTLLRKAAERGGVHPFYLDRLSDELARTIEQTAGWEAFAFLLRQMVRRYSELVKKTPRGVSPLVQKVMVDVDLNLAADQSLKSHAARLNVSAGYLSALFRRETGKTLTDYVNGKRAEHAAYLLRATRQSVSSIAQSCGVQDDNYFTKIFKKYMGKTPRQFREESRHHLSTRIRGEQKPSSDGPPAEENL